MSPRRRIAIAVLLVAGVMAITGVTLNAQPQRLDLKVDGVGSISAPLQVVLVLTLVDRLRGAGQLFRENGVPRYEPIFTIRDLGVEVDGSGEADVASH